MRFSRTEITTTTACCRRSARLTAALRKPAMESDAVRRRTLSMPAATDGRTTAEMRAMMHTTTSISISVTPRVLPVFPTADVRIDSLAARPAVGAIANHVRIGAMFPRVAVDVVVAPGILGNVRRDVRAGPILHAVRLLAQGAQPLSASGKLPGIHLVGGQRHHEAL